MKLEADKTRTTPRPEARKGRYRTHYMVLGTVVFILIILRLSAGWILEHAVNRRLSKIPGYSGHVGHIYLHLWRGAYSIHDIEIKKQTGKVSEPYFAAHYIDFSIAWKELIHRKVVSKIFIDGGQINIVHGADDASSQTEVDKRWQDAAHDLFPIDVTDLEITNGLLHYLDKKNVPNVDIYIRNMHAKATGFQNRQGEKSDEYPAKIDLEGDSIGNGKLKLYVQAEPLADKPHFYLSLALQDVAMPALNDLLLAYSDVEVNSGTFRVFVEVAAKGGRFEGYVKPFFEHLDFKKRSAKKSGIGHEIWSSVVAGFTNLFKNRIRDQLATRIPIQGEFGDAKAGIWATIVNMLHHGFVKALPQNIEGTVNPDEVKPKTSNGPDATTNQVKTKTENAKPPASGK